MISVRRYRKTYESDWNAFVAGAANATFLLDRRFLEYHEKRFADHSLLLFDNKTLVALLPANETGRVICSHGGLTYGGLLVKPDTSLLAVLSCFYALAKYYHQRGYKIIQYKPVPSFFHSKPCLQDMYALFLMGARLTVMNTGFVTQIPAAISKRRMRMALKAQKHNVRIVKTRDCSAFWSEILVPHLRMKFHTKPVHTIEEIETLRKRFPANILQFHAVHKNKLIAGTTIFWDREVAHTQYIAANATGRNTGALDYLSWYLLTHEFKNARYFSFGTTNMGSRDGRTLSPGLVEWKEGFTSSMHPYPCYDIETKNHKALERYA